MKQTFAIFLIGISCFLFACGNDARKHYNLGVDYQAQGKFDEAIAEYKTAIRIKPDFAEAHNNLGLAYFHQNKLNEAIAEFKTAISINPNLAEAHARLGFAYKVQSSNEQAIAHFKEFIRLAHTNPSLQGMIPQVQGWIQELESGE